MADGVESRRHSSSSTPLASAPSFEFVPPLEPPGCESRNEEAELQSDIVYYRALGGGGVRAAW